MSFIYSQALEGGFSRDNCSDTDACVPSNGSHTHRLSLSHDRTMDSSRLSRFGMTCKILTEDRGAELLTWWLAVSRARTYPSQEKAQESPENDPGCGLTWRGSLAKYDPDSRSWKTAQLSLLGDSELSSVIWPRSGMTAGGQCWELPTLGRRTSETDCGFSQVWPTPRCQMTRPVKAREKRGPGLNLEEAVAARMWPAPTVCGNYNRKGASATSGVGLATAVATSLTTNHSESMDAQTVKVMTFPTPTKRDYKGGYKTESLTRKDGESRHMDALPNAVLNGLGVETTTGKLNPQWVAWLMGWPIDHTSLKPSGTDKCPNVPQPPGDYSEAQHDVL